MYMVEFAILFSSELFIVSFSICATAETPGDEFCPGAVSWFPIWVSQDLSTLNAGIL
jgi:hypothetical protein